MPSGLFMLVRAPSSSAAPLIMVEPHSADSQELLRQQTTLARFGELALRSDDLDAILTEACRLAGEALGTDLAKVVELQPDGRTLKVRAGVGWRPGVVGTAAIMAEDDTSEGYALKTGEPMVSPNIATETRFRYAPFLIEAGAKAVANVIIIGTKDRPPFGILQVDSLKPREFTQGDAIFLRGYANLIAAAVARLRAIEEVRAEEARQRALLETQVAERTEALGRSNAQLDAFAYTISHDLRAPLRAMEGFARILLDDFAEPLGEKGERYAARIVTAAERMERLINDLLAYSRLQRHKAEPRIVDLGRTARRIAIETRAELGDAVEIALEPSMPLVLAEPGVRGQVITNLVANAAKFRHRGAIAHIRLHTEVRRDRVRLWVEDDGIGIAPEHQSRIFDVFERLHSQDAYPGTGIGLAIVKIGVECMAGTFGVESGLNEGSRFWIELPAAGNNGAWTEQAPS